MATVQNAELRAILRLQDEFSGKMNSIAGSAGSAFAGLGKAAAGAGLVVGGALAGGLALGVKAAGDLEQAVANISTIKPEIDTSAVFASLNELSTKVPQSAAQLGDALYDVFSSVNVSQADGIALTEKFAKSAVGAATDAKTFGTAAMGVMNAYGLAVADADHISDVFFNTIAAGVVTGEQLASGLGPIIGSAKAAGVDLNTVMGLIVGATKQGGDAAQNLNNVNNLLQKITTKEAVKAMNSLGVATSNAAGEFREMPAIFGDLKKNLAGLTEAGRANALQSIFPDAQARAGAQTIMDQLDAVNAAIDVNKSQSGAAASAYEKMSATFNSQSKLFVNAVTAALTTIGAAVLPAITPMITAFSSRLPGAMKVASDAIGTFKQAFAGQWRPGGVDEAGTVIWVDPMVASLGKISTIAGESWRTFKQALAGDWRPGGVDEAGNVIWVDPFVKSVGEAGQAVKGFLDAFGSPDVAASSGHATANMRDLNVEFDKLGAKFGGGKGPAFDAGESVKALNRELESLSGAGANALDLLNTLGDAFGAFGSGLALKAKAIQQVFAGDWMGAIESTKAAAAEFAKIPGIIDAQHQRALERLVAAAPELSRQARDTWWTVPTAAAEALVPLEPTVQAAIDNAVAILPELPAAVTTQLAPMEGAATELGAALETPVDTAILATVANADGTLPGIPKAVTDQHAVMFSASTALGESLQTPLAAGVLGAITDTESKMPGVSAAVRTEEGPARSAGLRVGQAIVDGLGVALSAGLGWVGDRAAALAGEAIRRANEALGNPHSPSPVFLAIGATIPQGLAAGIQQGSGPVTDAVQAVVDAAIRNGIEPLHLLALAQAESNLNPRASNTAGEDSHGLFQHNRAGGQGQGFSVAQLQDPTFSANKFAADHAALYKQLVAEGLAGEALVKTFGRLAEGSDPRFADRYALALREVTAQFGHTSLAAGQLGAGQQETNKWAEQMAAEQMKLSEVLRGHVDPDLIHMTAAMTNFGAVLGPIERQVAGGAISMETLRFKLVDLARATGLAATPWDDYNAGLIDMDEAMMQVVTNSASAGPQFEALREQLGTTNTITNEGTLQWLQLALAMSKVAPAQVAATTATTGLTTSTNLANDAIDPALLLQASDASRQMAESLGGAKSGFEDVKGAAAEASGIIREFLAASQSLGSYLDEHTFDFKVNIPDIPEWAIPGSPMPLETAFRGLTSAMRDNARISAPTLRDLEMPSLAMSSRSGGGQPGSGDNITINVTQRDGEDGETFARRVAAVLEKRTAEARRRG